MKKLQKKLDFIKIFQYDLLQNKPYFIFMEIYFISTHLSLSHFCMKRITVKSFSRRSRPEKL